MIAYPSLVLLPGMDGTGELFAPILPHLQAKFPVVIIDYPVDEMLDYATLTAKVLERCPAKNFVLVAESFSGPIAAQIIKHAPAQLVAVIFVCSFLRSPSQSGSLFRHFLSVIPKLRTPSWMTAIAVRRSLLNGCGDEGLVRSVVAAVERVEPQVLAGRLRELLSIRSLPSPPDRDLDVAYLRASNDRLVNMDAWSDVRSVFPHARYFELAAPHCVLQCRPAEAAAVITRYIESVFNPAPAGNA